MLWKDRLHRHNIGRVRAEIDRVFQLQPGDQPFLFVKQLAYRTLLENAVFHIPIQLASGLRVQGAGEQQMRLHGVDQIGGRVGVFAPEIRATAAEYRVETVGNSRVCEPKKLPAVSRNSAG